MRVAKRLIAAVWNGPFYIGKLERPVSLGDVAMKLLETLWRTVIVVSVLIGFAVVGAIVLDGLPTSKALYQRIEPSIAWGGGCEADMPLSVRLKNASEKRVGQISFKVAAYQPGRSTNLVSYLDSGHVIDLIVEPGDTATLCVVPPTMNAGAEGLRAASLQYVVEVTGADETQLRSAPAVTTPKPSPSAKPQAKGGVELPPCVDGSSTCKPWDRAWNKSVEDMTDEELMAVLGYKATKPAPPIKAERRDFDGSDIFRTAPTEAEEPKAKTQ